MFAIGIHDIDAFCCRGWQRDRRCVIQPVAAHGTAIAVEQAILGRLFQPDRPGRVAGDIFAEMEFACLWMHQRGQHIWAGTKHGDIQVTERVRQRDDADLAVPGIHHGRAVRR